MTASESENKVNLGIERERIVSREEIMAKAFAENIVVIEEIFFYILKCKGGEKTANSTLLRSFKWMR